MSTLLNIPKTFFFMPNVVLKKKNNTSFFREMSQCHALKLFFNPSTCQVWQAVRPLHQHADERHHLPAGRVHGHPEEHPRDTGGDGGQGEVGRDDGGAAAVPGAHPHAGRAPVPLLPHPGQGDGGHVPLPHPGNRGAIPQAGAGR